MMIDMTSNDTSWCKVLYFARRGSAIRAVVRTFGGEHKIIAREKVPGGPLRILRMVHDRGEETPPEDVENLYGNILRALEERNAAEEDPAGAVFDYELLNHTIDPEVEALLNLLADHPDEDVRRLVYLFDEMINSQAELLREAETVFEGTSVAVDCTTDAIEGVNQALDKVADVLRSIGTLRRAANGAAAVAPVPAAPPLEHIEELREELADGAGEVLVYREDPIVFASPWAAEHVAAIYHALGAKTWGEFRSLLPSGEWNTIRDQLIEVPPYEEEEEEEKSEADSWYWERDDEPFSMEKIPGLCDGDYPPWLQAQMGEVIPEDLLERYADSTMSFVSGHCWDVPPENLEPLLDALRARGFVVRKADDLEFR